MQNDRTDMDVRNINENQTLLTNQISDPDGSSSLNPNQLDRIIPTGSSGFIESNSRNDPIHVHDNEANGTLNITSPTHDSTGTNNSDMKVRKLPYVNKNRPTNPKGRARVFCEDQSTSP